MAGGVGVGGAGSSGGGVAGAAVGGAGAAVVGASVVGEVTGGTTRTASTVWAMPLVPSWSMTTRWAPLIVWVAGSTSKTSPLRALTWSTAKSLLLVELAGQHVSENEVPQCVFVLADVVPRRQRVDRLIGRCQNSDSFGVEEVDHRLR